MAGFNGAYPPPSVLCHLMYTRFASWGSSIFGLPSLATGGGWPFWEGARWWTIRRCCTDQRRIKPIDLHANIAATNVTYEYTIFMNSHFVMKITSVSPWSELCNGLDFDKLECGGGLLRQALLLAYKSGFQVWDVEHVDDVR
ncbi:hypothetical protein ZEAMMB73_Zm00001d024662 [Zea mays]|uniref:Uncharacterized protein n=1 Tax=Zea mays TaxID=4577 RepID=A0A1D6J0V9_MAIZE|nr:hypothetical protein ZEAMMB73_Zm00001d024662 [Zea mays]